MSLSEDICSSLSSRLNIMLTEMCIYICMTVVSMSRCNRMLFTEDFVEHVVNSLIVNNYSCKLLETTSRKTQRHVAQSR